MLARLAWPWNDRAGRFSALKLGTFCAVLAPALWLAVQAVAGWLGAKPITEAIHQSGDWAIRILLVSLAVTPLRHVAQWPKLIAVRRMLGLAALAYALLHLALYVVQQSWDIAKVVSEIWLRFYLTIGFVALVGLVILGATSTDAMIRRLGAENWNRLHKIVYGLASLGLLHYFLQSKLDVTQAVLVTGFFFWLMGFRLMRALDVAAGPVSLGILALAGAAATALAEAGWYAGKTGATVGPILEANLDFSYMVRPMWWVLAAGLGMVAVQLTRKGTASPRGRIASGPLGLKSIPVSAAPR